MKRILLLPVFLLAIMRGIAQPAKPASQTGTIADAINKIVADFRNNFVNIQGEKLQGEVEAETFRSKICLPGAAGCRILRYHSVEDHSASWQAGIYSGDSYDDALRQYKKIFGSIKNTRVSGPDATGNSFEGQMEKIDENVSFNVSSLRLKTKDAFYKNLVVEAELTSNYSGWEVHVNIYTKKPAAKAEVEDD